MPPKKKDKKNKGAVKAVEMTPEQRRQQQIAAKAELRKRMEDEARISKMNGLKITQQWRRIMRLAKAESLKKDIDILSQNHERDVDRKDAILQMLDRDLEEAEDQYQMTLRTHLVNVDTLIKLHDSRLYELERNFQKELKTMQTDFQNEKDVLTSKFTQEKRDLGAILEAIDREEEERESKAKHEFETNRETIRNKNATDIEEHRNYLDSMITQLEEEFQSAHLQYLQLTATKTTDFKKLTQDDHLLDSRIEKIKNEIDVKQTIISQWRAKIRQLQRETDERCRLLREEKMAIQKHYQELKRRIHMYRTAQNQRLLHLSTCANECKQNLNDKLEVARRVLKLSELGRKMETLEEQVLPFVPNEEAQMEDVVGGTGSGMVTASPGPGGDVGVKGGLDDTGGVSMADTMPGAGLATSASANNANVSAVVAATTTSGAPPAHQSSVMNPFNQPIPPADRLYHFYRKFNKTLLDNIAIEKERDRLAAENAQLEDLIRQFMDGTSINRETLLSDNPLFVVNGRANLNFVPPVRQLDGTLTVQEGNQIHSSLVKQHAWG